MLFHSKYVIFYSEFMNDMRSPPKENNLKLIFVEMSMDLVLLEFET